METLAINPVSHPLNATINVPGSKSLTNRALLIAALANGESNLSNALFSDDTQYFVEALKTLGFEIEIDPENRRIKVSGCSGRIPSKKASLFVGNAGTAARFLSAFLTLGDGEFILDGDARMRERPIGDLISALTDLGANIAPISANITLTKQQFCPPVKILAKGLPGGKTIIHGDISSQFLSAILMVSPYAQQAVEITVDTVLNSKPYVDMTIAIMTEFGVNILREGYQHFTIKSGIYRPNKNYVIEPDASAASYFFASPAILGGYIRVMNINRNSKQGDINFLDVLEKMGCSVIEGVEYTEVRGPRAPCSLQGVDVDMKDIPDTAPTLAVIAPFASSPTRIRGISSARVKESDRVSAICNELARLGVRVEEYQDGMSIYPCETFFPGVIKTYNDHRIAMAFTLVGLRIPNVEIENPGCVSKTFPEYFEVLDKLR